MNNTEIVLETTQGNQVATKLINPSLNINFNEGAIQISGMLDVKSISGRDMTMAVPFDQYAIRLKDLDSQPANVLSAEQQALLDSKKAIFQTLLDSVKSATQTAATAIYTLNNPSL